MRNYIYAVAALMSYSSVASAVDMPELAKKKNCAECHAIEKKLAGPAWLDVAKHYKGNNEASFFLPNKIKQGGFGVWGALSMPAQAVSDEEAKTLAKFILGLSSESKSVVSGR
jgi:cytochrome c